MEDVIILVHPWWRAITVAEATCYTNLYRHILVRSEMMRPACRCVQAAKDVILGEFHSLSVTSRLLSPTLYKLHLEYQSSVVSVITHRNVLSTNYRSISDEIFSMFSV